MNREKDEPWSAAEIEEWWLERIYKNAKEEEETEEDPYEEEELNANSEKPEKCEEETEMSTEKE